MGRALHVLIVEDSEDDHHLVIHALRRGGFDVTSLRVETADSMRSAFRSDTWDAVISDYSLPTFDGMAALEIVKSNGSDLPFIVVSGRGEVAEKMLQAGAHAFLIKSQLGELPPIVERELGEAEQRRLRKIAETKLRESQQHFYQALEAANLGAFNWDMVTGKTWRSHRYDEIVGDTTSSDQVDRTAFLDRVVPEDRERVKKMLDNMMAEGDFDFECEIIRDDASLTFVSARGKVIYDTNDKPVRMVGTIADITNRKKLEKEAREKEQLLHLLLDSTAEGILGIDLEGNCTMANPASARMLGYAGPGDLKGENLHQLLHHHRADGSPYPEEECRINHAYRNGRGVYVTDEVFWRKDETKLEVEYFSYPVIRDAQVIGAVVTFLDVSERKALEEQLRQSQKMEAIGQLAGGVAHDFNNILAVILMQAGLMGARELDPELREFVDEIGNAAQRAGNLTRQLLLFSRRQAMQMGENELNTIVRSLTKMLERVVTENISIQFKWSAERLPIKADAGMMDQVLMNLVINARDAMPDGGQLIIETAAKELDELMAAQMYQGRAGSFVCLSLSDTGCGIPLANLPRIFEPFFTTKEPDKGTGLGLATVYGIVRQHDGWIHVESLVGQGTTFRVYLPRWAHDTKPDANAVPGDPIAQGNETILLVEDDADVSRSLVSTLAQFGYKVLAARDGAEAMKLWQLHKSDIRLLLTDLVMPHELGGRELAAQLIAEKPGLKVIFTSGHSSGALPTDMPLEEGVNFLAKPYSSLKLAEILRKRLDNG